MDSFKKTALSHLLLSLLLLYTAAAAAEPLRHSCSATSGNYTSTGPFAANLNRLMIELSKKAPPIGFGLGSVGRDGPGRVHGLALCRGDARSSSCRACIRAASSEIRRLCPLKKDAVVWLDSCLLRYSNAEFFGEVDNEHEFFCLRGTGISASSSSASTTAEEFDSRVMEMMRSLRTKAYLSPLLFATRVSKGKGEEKMYGLAQCSRDLSGGDCNKCLEKAIAVLPGCCGGRRGGRVVGGSCYVRYELHPFFHDVA